MRNQGGCCSLGEGTQPVQAKMETPGKAGQKLVEALLPSCSKSWDITVSYLFQMNILQFYNIDHFLLIVALSKLICM